MGAGRAPRSGGRAEGTKSLIYQAAVTATKQQLDAEEKGIIDAMLTEDFRVAVKKFTSKSK